MVSNTEEKAGEAFSWLFCILALPTGLPACVRLGRIRDSGIRYPRMVIGQTGHRWVVLTLS